jgi:6-phosphofructokinase
MGEINMVGVVNGGGDAPGLNAVIRAVVRSAIGARGMRAIGTTFGDCT